MVNFHETRMGHTFFEDQLPQLILAIETFAAALEKRAPDMVLPVEADPEFLSELYYGNYEPATFKQTTEGADLTRTINEAHAALEETLSEDSQEKLRIYEDALTLRDSVEIKQAYESGYRTAVQMIVAGLSRPALKKEGI